MMVSAYLYQAINLLVAILMVPLLLRYLDVGGFVLWSIFTTFGGIALQIESAIQSVSVREIAREYHSGKVMALKAAVKKAKFAYLILSASVLGPFFIIGLFYLNYVADEKLGFSGNIEWLVFVVAYAINFYFGKNNSILLGMVRVAKYNNINSLTRVINFFSTYFLLKLGVSVLGICLSFIASVVIGCLLISREAKCSLRSFYDAKKNQILQADKKLEYTESSSVIKYTFFMLSSFVLYKGGLLVVVTIFSKDVAGSYGLTLQAFTMLSMLALVPLQVWLHKLVNAVALEECSKVLHELSVSVVVVNAIFIVGAVSLAFFGNAILQFIGSKILVLSGINLLLICLAFFVELNILLFVNFLVIKRKYEFVKGYVIVSALGVVSAVILTLVTKDDLTTLIMPPLILQTVISFPLVIKLTCHEISVTPKEMFCHIGKLIFLRY